MRDDQRKYHLAKYVAAYQATIANGYFATQPPAISVSATDPATGYPYPIVTTPGSALGTIYYLAGYKCKDTATATKVSAPGKTSTKNLALVTHLESTNQPYCLGVSQ
jgi:hypothetical protein